MASRHKILIVVVLFLVVVGLVHGNKGRPGSLQQSGLQLGTKAHGKRGPEVKLRGRNHCACLTFPALPLSLSTQEDAIGRTVYSAGVSCLNFAFKSCRRFEYYITTSSHFPKIIVVCCGSVCLFVSFKSTIRKRVLICFTFICKANSAFTV